MFGSIKNSLDQQRKALEQLEKEIHALETADTVLENERLQSRLSKLEQRCAQIEAQNADLARQNSSLKQSLHEQLYNEKMQLLDNSKKKLDVYFKDTLDIELNRLEQFERDIKLRIGEISKALQKETVDTKSDIFAKLDQLTKQANERISQARISAQDQSDALDNHKKSELQKFADEKLSDDEVALRTQQNNMEKTIGTSWANKLGILFIIIGVIALSQFTFIRLGDIFKGIFSFAIGIVMLAGGELLNRKKPSNVSLGVTAGGVAVLYAATDLSFFQLQIIGQYTALELIILITVVSFALSQYYSSQTIASFALIGGYLPLISSNSEQELLFFLMGYFVILNIFALSIALRKKWSVAQYIGFSFNTIATFYVVVLLFNKESLAHGAFISIIYTLFAFSVYLIIPIWSAYFGKHKFERQDVILLGLNTAISSLIIYILLDMYGLELYRGAAALAFTIIYLLGGRFIDKKLSSEQNVSSLFYLTGLTFAVLTVPLQFGVRGLSLGWLIESVVLIIYGVIKEQNGFRKYGKIIFSLCIAAFVLYDLPYKLEGYARMRFLTQYSSITLGSLLIVAAFAYKKDFISPSRSAFKNFAVANLWLYSMYIVLDEVQVYLTKALERTEFSSLYLVSALAISVSLLIAYLLPKIKHIADNTIRAISTAIYAIAILWLLSLNNSTPYTFALKNLRPATVAISTLIIVFINILSVLAMRDILSSLVKQKRLDLEWYPLLLSGYFVFILTQNLITVYNLNVTSFVISFIYIVTAFIWITYGFINRFASMRRFGLGLALLAIMKLFFLDLAFLKEGSRIAAYFVFGIILLATSFVYQHFSKVFEVKEVSKTDEN